VTATHTPPRDQDQHIPDHDARTTAAQRVVAITCDQLTPPATPAGQAPECLLDYALIQIEERITEMQDITPVTFTGSQRLRKGMGLNILGHPQGGPMMLSPSGNGVVGVYNDAGLIQYATRALNGSSGSPCFDDDWQPVAIHHAERATHFGSVREGALLGPIFDAIRSLLT